MVKSLQSGMTDVDKMLSDKKIWNRVAKLSAERKERLLSFGENARGILTKTKEGLFVVDPEDVYVSSALLRKGEYNAFECELAKSLINKKSDVLVVGSHIGTHAIALSKYCRCLTAIEANPYTFDLLQANINLNRCSNIKGRLILPQLKEQEKSNFWSIVRIAVVRKEGR